jgi:predicted O-methyltransferase YrrM
LRRLFLSPSHTITIRLGIAQRLHARRMAKARREIETEGFGHLLQGRADDALPPDPACLMFLYRAVRNCGAGRVIEFGSGQSTIFIAQALHDQGFGHLWALEADAHWLRHTQSLIPEYLIPFVTLVHSPVILTSDHGPPAWRYTVVPEGEWDFLFLDGPAGTAESTMTVNLIELLHALNKGARGLIDHRWKTTMLTREAVGRELAIRYLPSLESFTIRRSKGRQAPRSQ